MFGTLSEIWNGSDGPPSPPPFPKFPAPPSQHGFPSSQFLAESLSNSLQALPFPQVAECSSTTLHDEFLQICRDSGLEDIAKDAGVLRNGQIPDLQSCSTLCYVHHPVASSLSAANAPLAHQAIGGDMELANETRSPLDKCKDRVDFHYGTDDEESQEEGQPSAKRQKRCQSIAGVVPKRDCEKGLRHFSQRVCEKVERRKKTSYNQVADELVGEGSINSKEASTAIDQNIRRRVYDVLNVLMALDIISKHKKEITWVGLPTNAKHELEELVREKKNRCQSLRMKQKQLRDLISQQRAYENLFERNRKAQIDKIDTLNRIHIPFVIISTKNSTIVQCEVADDRTHFFFNFQQSFEIRDDNEILKWLGLAPPSSGGGGEDDNDPQNALCMLPVDENGEGLVDGIKCTEVNRTAEEANASGPAVIGVLGLAGPQLQTLGSELSPVSVAVLECEDSGRDATGLTCHTTTTTTTTTTTRTLT